MYFYTYAIFLAKTPHGAALLSIFKSHAQTVLKTLAVNNRVYPPNPMRNIGLCELLDVINTPYFTPRLPHPFPESLVFVSI